MINPPIGCQFSFPWVRGPHDQLIEYNDAVNSFESMRITVYKFFTEFSFCGSLMNIFHAENEQEHVVTKLAVMRIITQLARIKKDNLTELGLTHLQAPSEVLIQNSTVIHTLNQTVTQSKDHILKSVSLLIQHQLLKMLMRSSRNADISQL